MSKSSKVAALGATILALANLGVAFALAPGRQAPETGDFGLTKGVTWTYRRTRDNEKPETWTKEVTRVLEVKGRYVAEIKGMSPSYNRHDYIGLDANGLYQYHGAYLNDWPGVQEDWEPTPMLKLPLGKGEIWKWTEIQAVQTAGGSSKNPVKVDKEQFRINTTATVEGVGVPLKTAAGTFTTYVVNYEQVGKRSTTTYRRWFSPEVGLVRQETTRGKVLEVVELTGFSRGTSPRPGRGGRVCWLGGGRAP